MTTPTGPYRVEYPSGSLLGTVVGPLIVGDSFVFVSKDGSELSAAGWVAVLNSTHRSARAPLLELLRECELCLTSLMDESGLPPEPRATLTRIRAVLKEAAP